MVLATRVDPPLPLARLRARGELLEVRAADLRFTGEEAAAYLNGPMGLALTEHDVAALDGRTEGWIAALQLAALSMQGRDDAGAFIAGFAGDDRYVVDYLAEEVLARQPDDVRDFLLETSILDRLSGPLCDAVTGRDGGRATLVALERANLFLVPLDDRRQWYRYHHLFADVLRAHLAEERAGRGRRSCTAGRAPGSRSTATPRGRRARAAGGRRRPGRRADGAGDAGDAPGAPGGRARALGAVAARRRSCGPGRCSASPSSARWRRFASSTPSSGGWPTSSAPCAPTAAPGRSTPPGLVVVDEEGYRSVPAGLEIYRAALALRRGDLDAAVAHAREALALAPAADDLTRAAAGALAGLASWTRGDLAAAHAAYTESVAGLHRAGFVADVLGCCITLGDIRRTQGRLGDAEHIYRWALDLLRPRRRCGARPTCTSGWPGCCSSATTSPGPPSTSPRPGASASTTGCRRTPTAGGWSRRGCREPGRPRRRPRAARRGRAGLRRRLLPERGARARRARPAAAAARRAAPRRGVGPRTGAVRRRRAVLPARVRAPHPRPAPPRPPGRAPPAGLLDRLLAAAEEGGRAGSVIEVLVLQALAARPGGRPGRARRPAPRRGPGGAGGLRPCLRRRGPADGGAAGRSAAGPRVGYVRRLLAACAGTRAGARRWSTR